ncbi:MAG: S41 family peptidase [Odoribacter sp.]|nr:S41 family peptidase [Odoribacter sp.]
MKKILIAIFILIALAPAVAQYGEMTSDQKLRAALAIIESYYVEDVNSDSLVDEAIVSMLHTLDPHSAYSTPQETEELNQPLEGKFSGIGIQFSMVEDTVYVIQTTGGGPSEKVGIRPGDRIISANDTVIAGKKLNNSGIIKVLRGPKGSIVTLKVKRQGVPELIEFRIERDDIPIYSVDAAYMVNDSVGYISVSRFAEHTDREMVDAIKRLSAKGMQHLMLDLSSNGGGYLGSAFEMASEFLEPGDPVVFTRGLHARDSYFNVDERSEIDVDRLVVIVDQYSASASEIFSGAIQENDRGLIVGRRTFGKGLVQRPFPFPDGSMIRLTTSRYYTPTGRCIQKPYEKGHGEEYQLDMLNRFNSGELWHADSVKLDTSTPFYTLRNHRVVYGGGGIMPDVFVPVDTSRTSPYYRDIIAKSIVNKYVLNYIETNRGTLLKEYPTEDDFAAHFTTPDDMLRGLIDAAEADGVPFNEKDWETSREIIAAMLKGLMLRDMYDNGTYVRATNPLNPDFREALDLISDPVRYKRLLSGKN